MKPTKTLLLPPLPFRFTEWWMYKTPFILSICYAAVITHTAIIPFTKMALFLISYAGLAIYGYLLNDRFDIHSDKRAGKYNKLEHIPKLRFLLLLVLSLAFGALPWVILPFNNIILYLLLLEVVLLTLYCIPPFRLKEKGWLAVVTDCLYGFVVPFWIATVLFFEQGQSLYIALIFCLWITLIGIRNILAHQLQDYENDMASGISTVAVAKGKKHIRILIEQLSCIELLSLIALCSTLGSPFIFLPILFIIHSILAYKRELFFIRQNEYQLPAGYQFISNILLNEFYQCWLPLSMLAYLCFLDLHSIWLICLHCLLFYSQLKILLHYIRHYYYYLKKGLFKALSLFLKRSKVGAALYLAIKNR